MSQNCICNGLSRLHRNMVTIKLPNIMIPSRGTVALNKNVAGSDHTKSQDVHIALVCCFPAQLAWACASANAVLVFDGARCTPIKATFLLRYVRVSRQTPREPQLYHRFGTARPALAQGRTENRGATPAATMPTSRHRRACARTKATDYLDAGHRCARHPWVNVSILLL